MDKLEIQGTEFEIDLVRNAQRKFSIEVVRRQHLRVSAPDFAPLEAIKERISRKSNWILAQDRFLKDHPPELPKKEYIAGESFYLLGEQYTLKIDDGNEGVRVKGRNIIVNSNSEEKVKPLFFNWHKEYSKNLLENLFFQCLEQFQAKLGIEVNPKLKIRKMKRRWGSCTPNNLITLNTELVAAKQSCIEYVIYHELTHTLHLQHSEKFYSDLRKVCPRYKELKHELDKETNLFES